MPIPALLCLAAFFICVFVSLVIVLHHRAKDVGEDSHKILLDLIHPFTLGYWELKNFSLLWKTYPLYRVVKIGFVVSFVAFFVLLNL